MKILPISELEDAARIVVKLSKIVSIAKDANISVAFGTADQPILPI